MIVARQLEKRYGEKLVLRGLDFELERGGFLVVTGPNGSGKTTLLRLCAGLAIPSGGTLEVEPDPQQLQHSEQFPGSYLCAFKHSVVISGPAANVARSGVRDEPGQRSAAGASR